MDVKDEIRESVLLALNGIGLSPAEVLLEHPTDLSHGDIATGLALQLAKSAGEQPKKLAEKLVAALPSIPQVAKIEIAGPGFINFHLSATYFAEVLKEAAGETWGANKELDGKRIMVEYTDPNPFKEFHVGHLMSNAIGESISRLLEHSGAVIKRANYQGDVGPHVAKALWALQKQGLHVLDLAAIASAYAEGAKAYDEDPAAKVAIDELNAVIYEKSDPGINSLYEEGKSISLAHFEDLYALLGTKFDYYFFESETAQRGLTLIREHSEAFEVSEGATVYRGEKKGLHTRVFVTSKGLPTYEAKELGLALMKAEVWQFDSSITITAAEQDDYFKVALAAMEEVMPDIAVKTEHISHGMMRLPEGKMSSRTGNVVSGESLLLELMERAHERAKESRAADADKLAKDVAVAAVKYQILKQASGRNIAFDKERALSLEGDSGPYLQYAHARANAVVAKARESGISPRISESAEPSNVARLLVRFPEVVANAARAREPHLLTNYLLQFAAAFNRWYAAEQIVNDSQDSPHKVALTDAVRATLKRGLHLLGIPAPDKM